MRLGRGHEVVLSVLLGACAPSPASSVAHTHDSTTVAALVHERLQAALAGDTARWHRQVSDSCLWTGPGLRVVRTHEVLASILANRALRPTAQQIRDLVVQVSGDVAQATYVQLVQDAGQAPEAGKRFRKTDVYQREDRTWHVIGAAEVAVPFRTRVVLDAAQRARLLGRFALADVETLTVAATAAGAFTLRGRDGTVDTLWAATDSTLFEEGDAGTWVFTGLGAGTVTALVYRSAGAADVVLARVRPR